MSFMKIYTKTGDQGFTSLYGGKRLKKDDIRIEAYGTIDELNAFIGLCATRLKKEDLKLFLQKIQSRLFTIGSNLASDPEKEMITPDILPEDIRDLENKIDEWDQVLPRLKYFILPGGGEDASYAHVCRTVCRRAERRIITLSEYSAVDPLIITYVNRLSDFFFVLSRILGHENGEEEIPWIPR
jgi:cob(I)alamin adenosyltransferase